MSRRTLQTELSLSQSGPGWYYACCSRWPTAWRSPWPNGRETSGLPQFGERKARSGL